MLFPDERMYPISASDPPAKAAFPAFCIIWKLTVNPVSTKSFFSMLLSVFVHELAYVQIVNLAMLKSQIKTETLYYHSLKLHLLKGRETFFAFQFIKLMLWKRNTVSNTPVLGHSQCSLCSWRPLRSIRYSSQNGEGRDHERSVRSRFYTVSYFPWTRVGREEEQGWEVPQPQDCFCAACWRPTPSKSDPVLLG